LHVLAEAVFSKFPELVAVGEELTTVPQAAKCKSKVKSKFVISVTSL